MVHTGKCYCCRKLLHWFIGILYCSALLWWEWVSRSLFVKSNGSIHPGSMFFTSAHLLCSSTLSQCCHAAVALLYPFVWQHTYIPVLPPAMLDIVCTPTPFIVGLLSSSLSQLTELPLEEVKRASLDHGPKVNWKSFNITTPMADFLYQQVLVVDLENNRLLRQVNASHPWRINMPVN